MLLPWLQQHFPGRSEKNEQCLRIWHDCGDTSTLWYRPRERKAPQGLPACLNGFYDCFDAADILSSAFKVSSPDIEIIENTVHLVCSQAELRDVAREADVKFPDGAVPFMMEAGVWIYAYGLGDSAILQGDLEYGKTGDTFPDLLAVLDNWREAVATE